VAYGNTKGSIHEPHSLTGVGQVEVDEEEEQQHKQQLEEEEEEEEKPPSHGPGVRNNVNTWEKKSVDVELD